jgi:hypothetical protein
MVEEAYCNCSEQMLRHSLAGQYLLYTLWRHNVIDISLLFVCLRYWTHISYRKQGALFTERGRVDWLLSASWTRSKFLWKMLLLKRATCCLALRSFSNVSHTDVLSKWMLRICNPNKLQTWLRCADVPSYIISHFSINSATDHVYCSWYSLPASALRGSPVALREFHKYHVTTILNLNRCEAISILSLFPNVVHSRGTVLILLRVVNAECTYDLH